MKSENVGIVLSIKQEYVKLILEGKKTVEVRKTIPKKFVKADADGLHLKKPFKCYIYCTRNTTWNPIVSFRYESEDGVQLGDKKYKNTMTGSVVGEFTCDKVECFTTDYRGNPEQNHRIAEEACLNMIELAEYEGNAHCLYALHISNLVIYEESKNLYNMSRPGAATIDEMAEELCSAYCYQTDYGKKSAYSTPNGYYCCEGKYCNSAYEDYLEQFEIKKAPQSWCYCNLMEEWK